MTKNYQLHPIDGTTLYFFLYFNITKNPQKQRCRVVAVVVVVSLFYKVIKFNQDIFIIQN